MELEYGYYLGRKRIDVGFIRKTEVVLYEYYFGEKSKFYVVLIVEKELVCIENVWRERVGLF